MCSHLEHIFETDKGVQLQYVQSCKKYSAAVKPRPSHPRKWVLHLSRDLKKPKHWNDVNQRWSAVRVLWMEMLWLCDDFLAGKVPDPLPKADHYGDRSDADRARRAGWHKLKTNYNNIFWSIKDPAKKVTP